MASFRSTVIDARAMVTAKHGDFFNPLERWTEPTANKSSPTGQRANYAPESTENSRRLSLSRLPDFQHCIGSGIVRWRHPVI